MPSTAALKSIEALLKEAETVIGDGVPMVAIVKSAPPVAKPDIPVAKRPTTLPADDAAPDHNPANAANPSDKSSADQKAETQTGVFDRIEMLRSMAATLEDDQPETNLVSRPVAAEATAEHIADAASSSLPNAPPVPAYQNQSPQISDHELDDVIKKTVDEIVAVTPLDSVVSGNERIESVMADIADAVGKAETSDIPSNAEMPESDNIESNNIGSDNNKPDKAGTSAVSANAAAAIDLDDLNDIVANTVKSVIREELSNLVQSTVKSTLNELRAAQDDTATNRPSD